MRVRARWRPGIIGRIRGDSVETSRAHLSRQVVSELGIAGDDLPRHVRLDRRHIRRQKHARAVFALLMYVVDYLWMPGVKNFFDSDLRLDLGKGVPIAIVIMAGVFVIKLGRGTAFKGRA